MLRCSQQLGRLSTRMLTLSVSTESRSGKKGSSKKIIRDGGWKRIKFNPNYYPEHSSGNPLEKHDKPTWQKDPKASNNAHNVAKFYKENKMKRFMRVHDEVEGERYYQHNHWKV